MKKKATQENYLDNKPLRNPDINWTSDDKGVITLEIENKGVMKKITQILFKKPKISYIHLDEMGSFIWPLIDGESDITALGKKVDEHFGEKAHPLYERLAQYIKILASYGFVKFN
ncbi:MAG: PqqD family protein [Clostridia bacterium]|nr:PqqD family protein [Clostridia bacterium]